MSTQLIIPMYRLITTKTIEEINYESQDAEFFRRDYILKEREQQFEILTWALENPKYDFKSISPIFKNLKFSNDEVYIF